ncbi:glutamate--tRNA ligase [Nanoarchaeota archaeon NZ13-N]|nr:MAG: glutamate--tRNA ligase [Nanoarchaeota archaeon NZ13-N]
MDYIELARKWAIYLRSKYDRIELGSIVSRLVAELPDIKKEIKNIIPEISKVIKEVEGISKEEARRILEEKYPELLEIKKEERKGLPLLEGAKNGKVATRFAPNPSGYLHIGHARAIILSYEYAKMYNGKFILRLEDTDPKVKKPVLEAYEKIKDDVEWLIEDKVREMYIQSERLDIYYNYIRKLIEMGYAYVDLCDKDTISRNRRIGKECEHRNKDIGWNLEQFEKMLNGEYDEEEAVIRVKTDLSHPNPSVRDWIAFRIVNPKDNLHPWLLYKYGENYAEGIWLWPTYNFSVVIDDHLMGVTHVFRMKEHEVNTLKQEYVYKYFGWEMPKVTSYGALLVKDVPLHKSEIKKLIDEGKISGWDYPFLATLQAIRRRGIQPAAIKRYIVELGVSPVDIYVDWERIYSYNREIIDKKAKRYFIIKEPMKVFVRGIDLPYNIKIRNHPTEDLGERYYEIRSNVFFLEREDVLGNRYLRLMDAFNIEVVEIKEDYAIANLVSYSLEDARKINAKIVHWLYESSYRNIKILEPFKEIFAMGEKYLDDVKEGEIIQAVRYGFLKKEGDHFIFIHK